MLTLNSITQNQVNFILDQRLKPDDVKVFKVKDKTVHLSRDSVLVKQKSGRIGYRKGRINNTEPLHVSLYNYLAA